MTTDWRQAALRLFDGVLARTHLSRPTDVAGIVVEEAQRSLQASEVVLFWVNREQRALVPIPTPLSPAREPQAVDGSMAGRCFTSSKLLSRAAGDGRSRVFVPLVDGTDRVGVLELVLPDDLAGESATGLPEVLVRVLERFGHTTAMVLVAKLAYGDTLELVQRSRVTSCTSRCSTASATGFPQRGSPPSPWRRTGTAAGRASR